jgi:hypothetical protein
LSAAAISSSTAWASATSAPKANINGANTNTAITDVKIREVALGGMRRGKRATNRP